MSTSPPSSTRLTTPASTRSGRIRKPVTHYGSIVDSDIISDPEDDGNAPVIGEEEHEDDGDFEVGKGGSLGSAEDGTGDDEDGEVEEESGEGEKGANKPSKGKKLKSTTPLSGGKGKKSASTRSAASSKAKAKPDSKKSSSPKSAILAKAKAATLPKSKEKVEMKVGPPKLAARKPKAVPPVKPVKKDEGQDEDPPAEEDCIVVQIDKAHHEALEHTVQSQQQGSPVTTPPPAERIGKKRTQVPGSHGDDELPGQATKPKAAGYETPTAKSADEGSVGVEQDSMNIDAHEKLHDDDDEDDAPPSKKVKTATESSKQKTITSESTRPATSKAVNTRLPRKRGGFAGLQPVNKATSNATSKTQEAKPASQSKSKANVETATSSTVPKGKKALIKAAKKGVSKVAEKERDTNGGEEAEGMEEGGEVGN